MNRIITIIVALLLAAAPTIASAQGGKVFRQTKVIFENEVNEGELRLSVFSIPENGQDHYFAALGNLGIGDDIIQFNIDPVSVLYIPLGSTLSEAQAKLEEIKALLKQPVDASMEVPGCLAVGFPDDEYEAYRTARKLLKKFENNTYKKGYAAYLTDLRNRIIDQRERGARMERQAEERRRREEERRAARKIKKGG